MEKLTPEQESQIGIIRDQWISHYLNSGYETDYKTLRPLIDWCYKKAGIDSRPFIFIADGYTSQKLMINYVIRLLEFCVKEPDSQVRDQVWSQVWSQVGSQVRDQVESQVRDQVESQVRSQVRDQVESQVESQVRDQVESQVEFYEQWFGSWNAGWLSFYDYFYQIGLLKDPVLEKYTELQKQGFSIVMFKHFVVVCKMPTKTHKTNRGLHCLTGSAIEWRDGINTSYYIHGVSFSNPHDLFDNGKLYWDVVKRRMKVMDILKLENIEQRYVALQYYGFENCLEELGAKLLDKSKRGNELYSIQFEAHDLRLLRYKDPSTDRWYGDFVKPEFQKADEAMAWKHNCTEEEYELLTLEA